MAGNASSFQKASLRRLGYSESEINGMSFEAAKRKLSGDKTRADGESAKRVVHRTQRAGSGKAPEAPEVPKKGSVPSAGDSRSLIEKPTKGSVPSAGNASSYTAPDDAPTTGKSKIPQSGSVAVSRDTEEALSKGKSKIPQSGSVAVSRDTEEALSKGKSKIPQSGSVAFSQGDDIIPNKALKAAGSVADAAPTGGIGSKVSGALETLFQYADEIPGAKAFFQGLGKAAKVAGPVGAAYGTVSELEGTALNEGEDKDFALLERRLQEMSPEDRTRYLLTGQSPTQAPMSGSEDPGLGGAPAPVSSNAPTSPSERRLATVLGGGGLGAPSTSQAAPEAPAEATPMPGRKPMAPPQAAPMPERKPMAPTAPAQAPQEDPSAKLQQMFGLMKESGVSGFNWGDKAFVRDEQMPSGYRVLEAEQAATELSQTPAPGGLGGPV